MLLSNPAKYFLAFILSLLFFSSCGPPNSDNTEVVPVVAEPKGRFPFDTKEPKNYQCEIVETAGGNVRRKRIARKGNWLRIDYDFGEKQQRALLRANREYLIDLGRNIYFQNDPPAGNTPGSPFSDLTRELLTVGRQAAFEEIGRDGSIIRYRVIPADADASEIVLHYDEAIRMPVKQEFFSIEGGERTLRFTIEVVNFKAEAEEGLFAVPDGTRKVSADEFYRQR